MVSRYLLNLSQSFRLVLLGIRHLYHPIFLKLREKKVRRLTILETTPVHLVVKLDHVSELKDSFLSFEDLTDKVKVLEANKRRIYRILEDLLGLGLWLFNASLVGHCESIRGFSTFRKLNIDDSSVEDIDEVFVLIDILVDTVYIEVLMLLLRQFLEGEKVFKDDTA